MSCPPAMCGKRADCPDLRCPGHPGISDEQSDKPIVSHEEAEGWFSSCCLYFLAAVTCACVLAVFITFANT